MLKIEKIEATKLIISIPLNKNCSNCGKRMISWFENIPKEIIKDISLFAVVQECYDTDPPICLECVNSGIYKKSCTICREVKVFPKDFKYQLIFYPKYPEDETEYLNICKECTKTYPERIMDLIATSDNREILN